MLELQVEEACMPGKYRMYDDYKIVDTGRRTFIIADGIGGHQAPIEASSIASNVAYAYIWGAWEGSLGDDFNHPEPAKVFEYISQAVQEANLALHTLSEHLDSFCITKKLQDGRKVRKDRAGTTMDFCYFSDDNLYLAHVGDSSVYLLRNGKLFDLTSKSDPGIEMTREMGPRHKGLKFSYVGREETIEPYLAEIKLQEGDVVLMATDGLTKLLNDEQIAEVLQKSEGNAASNLLELVEDSEDAVTVVVLKAKNKSDV